jgi:hypothetical protein
MSRKMRFGRQRSLPDLAIAKLQNYSCGTVHDYYEWATSLNVCLLRRSKLECLLAKNSLGGAIDEIFSSLIENIRLDRKSSKVTNGLAYWQ